MRKLLTLFAVAALPLVFAPASVDADDGEYPQQLPKAVRQLLKDCFDGARVENIEHEEGLGDVYEITLLDGSLEKTVRVSASGLLIGVHQPAAASKLPKAVRATIREKAKPRSIGEVHRIDLSAQARYVKLEQQKESYAVVIKQGNRHAELIFKDDGTLLNEFHWHRDEEEDDDDRDEEDGDEGEDDDDDEDGDDDEDEEDGDDDDDHGEPERDEPAQLKELPQAIQKLLKNQYQDFQASIADVDEHGAGLIFGIRLSKKGQEDKVIVLTESAQHIGTRQFCESKSLPEKVRAQVSKLAPKAKLVESAKLTQVATFEWVKLEKPVSTYEVEVHKDGQQAELILKADGQLMNEIEWINPDQREEREREDDDDDDDDDDEDEDDDDDRS